MSGRERVLLLSEQSEVRKVVARVLRWNGYEVVDVANPRAATLSSECDIAVIDVAGRNEDLDAVARDILATNVARGLLFFDGSNIEAALRSLRTLIRDVRGAVDRFRGE